MESVPRPARAAAAIPANTGGRPVNDRPSDLEGDWYITGGLQISCHRSASRREPARALVRHVRTDGRKRDPGARGAREREGMWQHNYEPVGGSYGLSAVVAAIQFLVLLFMLGVLRKPAWMSAAAALVSAVVVALFGYGMPVQMAIMSTLMGAAYGVFPIAWIVFSSIMLYL